MWADSERRRSVNPGGSLCRNIHTFTELTLVFSGGGWLAGWLASRLTCETGLTGAAGGGYTVVLLYAQLNHNRRLRLAGLSVCELLSTTIIVCPLHNEQLVVLNTAGNLP